MAVFGDRHRPFSVIAIRRFRRSPWAETRSDGKWTVWDTDGKGTFNETHCVYKNGKGQLVGKGKIMWCKQTN